MTSTHSWIVAALAAASIGLGLTWASPAHAQDKDKPKDEGLERLLDKIEDAKPAPAKEKDKADPAKPAGEVPAEDKGLDKLLEGLGQTKDAPAPDDKKPGGGPGAPDDRPTPPKAGGDKKSDPLEGEAKKLDDLLEEKTGRKPKKPGDKKPGQGQGPGQEGGGPLGDIVKEMRDVEERLGKPDTGEETRKKQTEIVKNLDTLIEQMKNSPSQSQGLKMLREGKKPGGPPGGQSNQQGATGDGANKSRPEKPKPPGARVEIAKEIWGQLPAQVRDDMANVLNEVPLPTKEDLIRLYYLSLGKKTASSREN